jgi:hypothetical protein
VLRKDKRAALTVDLGDVDVALLILDAPRDPEAEPVNIERQRGVDARHVKYWTREPLGHVINFVAFVFFVARNSRSR